MTHALTQRDVEKQSRKNAPVAVFDSGIGGISVLKEIKKLLPHENLLYFGDGKNAPYGEKDADTLRALIFTHAAALLHRAKALVLACNTATAVAAKPLRNAYPRIPIIGMEPAVKPALDVAPHPRILILATTATLHEEKLKLLLHRYRDRAEFLPLAAPGLVELVEAGAAHTPEAERYLCTLLAPFLASPPDAVVLGCTHFPLAKSAISRVFSDTVPLFDGAEGTARELKRRLERADLLNAGTAHGTVTLSSCDTRALPRYLAALATE